MIDLSGKSQNLARKVELARRDAADLIEELAAVMMALRGLSSELFENNPQVFTRELELAGKRALELCGSARVIGDACFDIWKEAQS